MMYRYAAPLVALFVSAGCADRTGPTSIRLEQAVFNALGGLQVGETLVLQGADAEVVAVGGTSVAGQFAFIPFHADTAAGSNLLLSVSGVNAFPPVGAAEPLAAPAPAVHPDEANWRRHEELFGRLQEQTRPFLARAQRSAAFQRSSAPARYSVLGGGTAQVGQVVPINVSTSAPACTSVDNRMGRVEAISQHAIVVGDVNNPSGGFTTADYDRFAQEFDRIIHPTVTRYFGEPTDIDGNSRAIIFFTRAVNELTPPGSAGFVAGFFYSRDLFLGIDGCPASNEGEIFYILVPDPNAEASHIQHSRDRVYESALGTIGHEYQHLINAGRRIYVNNAFDWEEVWLDEGLSHIAEEALFYADSGLSPGSNVRVDILDQRGLDAINRYAVSNLARYSLYLANVTRHTPIGADLLETRGAIWSFLRYAADHSGRTDPDFFHPLVNSQVSGFANLRTALDQSPIERLRQWGVSVYTDDFVRGDSLLQQPSWNFRNLLPLINTSGAFPLPVRTLGSTQPVDFNLRAGTSGYVRFRGSPGEVTRVTTTSGGAPPPSTLQVTVVRIE